MLQGKKILLCVTGSIAAYKAVVLVRLLIKAGAEVRVVMTPAARDFVAPLSFSTLSKNPVLTELSKDGSWVDHVHLGRWADLMVVAPLSANTLAKMARGLCDNLLLATYLSATCPVLLVPAMDEDMWRHPATRANLDLVRSFGNAIIPVESGELASGLYGEGRMAEPEAIVAYIGANFFFPRDLEGKNVLITAGPTREPLDPVRFIGNHSSGKMGLALAREMAGRGARVNLVLGPVGEPPAIPDIAVRHVESAQDMYLACMELFPQADITVMAAAVADYAPVSVSPSKIKKKDEHLMIELKRTRDILRTLGLQKKEKQLLVGFALENQHEREYAVRKLEEKNADLIVLNSLRDEGAGFGFDTNKIIIFGKGGVEYAYERKPKQQVARDIVDRIVNLLYA